MAQKVKTIGNVVVNNYNQKLNTLLTTKFGFTQQVINDASGSTAWSYVIYLLADQTDPNNNMWVEPYGKGYNVYTGDQPGPDSKYATYGMSYNDLQTMLYQQLA